AARLEHFRHRQEAARGFDDDLEFCPSLTAHQLAEFRHQLSVYVSSSASTSPHPSTSSSTTSSASSPPLQHTRLHTTLTRAIPIIDPSNKTPLPISSIPRPSTSSGTKGNPYASRPTSPYHTAHGYSSPPPPMQLNPYSPPRSHSHSHNHGVVSFAAVSSFPWQHTTSPPPRAPMVRQFSVPIVDPSSGNVLLPGGMVSVPSSSTSYHHISVR
ncbi:hypothetical protein BC936DRAFT_139365, partial [Jimgerdemannia flammicorona]